MKKIPCEIIEDLLPLVKDGVASEESRDLVRNHLETCQSCRQEMEGLPLEEANKGELKDERIIKDIKRKVLLTQTGILVFGTILGVALTFTIGVFYNIILIPFLGGLSYLALKKRWYLTPLAIVVLSYLWQLGQSLIGQYFSWSILYGALIMTGIYGALSLLGVLIGFLLKFALEKEDGIYEK